MAACCALEPAPFRVPLSCVAPSLPPLAAEVSLAAPQAASAREPASTRTPGATPRVTARLVLLKVTSLPLDGPGRRCRARDCEGDARKPSRRIRVLPVNGG